MYSGYLKWKENGERWKTSGLQTRASEVNLSERKKKKKRGVPHALPILFSINLLLLGKHACFRETTFVTFSPFTDLSLKLLTAGAPVSAQRNQMTNQGRPSLFGVLRRLPDNHQLMNDLFVTQIENCRRSRVLLASEKDCRVDVSLSESCDLRCRSAKVARLRKTKKKQKQNLSRASSTLRQNLSGLVSILTVLSAERFPFPSDFSSVGFGSQRSSSAATLCVAALGSCVGAFAQGRSPLAPLVILLQRRN